MILHVLLDTGAVCLCFLYPEYIHAIRGAVHLQRKSSKLLVIKEPVSQDTLVEPPVVVFCNRNIHLVWVVSNFSLCPTIPNPLDTILSKARADI